MINSAARETLRQRYDVADALAIARRTAPAWPAIHELSLWLGAQDTGAEVVGITLSPVQARRAEERAREAERHTAIRATLDPAEAVADRNVLVIAVKPKDVGHLLDQIRDLVKPGQVVVSLAAGVPVAVLESELEGVAVVRAMPNTPAAVDEGMTAYCAGNHADSDALALANMVLAAVGETIQLSEDLLDAVQRGRVLNQARHARQTRLYVICHAAGQG